MCLCNIDYLIPHRIHFTVNWFGFLLLICKKNKNIYIFFCFCLNIMSTGQLFWLGYSIKRQWQKADRDRVKHFILPNDLVCLWNKERIKTESVADRGYRTKSWWDQLEPTGGIDILFLIFYSRGLKLPSLHFQLVVVIYPSHLCVWSHVSYPNTATPLLYLLTERLWLQVIP